MRDIRNVFNFKIVNTILFLKYIYHLLLIKITNLEVKKFTHFSLETSSTSN